MKRTRGLAALSRLALVLPALLLLVACSKEIPNGPSLLFVSYTSNHPGFYSIDANGEHLRLVSPQVSQQLSSGPVVSPDGKRLAFACRADQASNLPNTDVCLSTSDGFDIRVATQGKLPSSGIVGKEMAWAPDSKSLAFAMDLYTDQVLTASGEIYVLDVESQQSRVIIPGTPDVQRKGIRWAPDSRRLAFLGTTAATPETTFEVIDVQSGARLDLTKLTPEQDSIGDFAWSPDGSVLAFVNTIWRTPFTAGIAGGEVYSISPDGSNLHRFPDVVDWPKRVIWSPDGRWLTVIAAPVGGGLNRIHILPAGGGDPRLLAAGLVDSDLPVWSPDGQRVAFGGAEKAPEPIEVPPLALYVANIEGGDPIQLAPDLHPSPFLTWSPDGRRVFFTSQGSPCVTGCPPGFLYSVPSDGSDPPAQITDYPIDALLGWQP